MKMNKKGIIEQLQAIIVPIIAIAIVLVVGFLIMAEGKTQVVEISGVSQTHTNESIIGWANNTGTALNHSNNCMTLSCSEVINSSGSLSGAPSTIYTCAPGQGITLYNWTSNINASILVTYSCTPKTTAYNATTTIQNATQDIPGWLPIIIITIIGALLIGLVAVFRRST